MSEQYEPDSMTLPDVTERRARTAIYAGAGAALASLAAIALLSRRQGHSPVRAVNATSHVIHGPEDAPSDEVDARRTAPGLLINIGSAFFWGAVFATTEPGRGQSSTRATVGRAFMTALAAGIIDYGLVPRRLRPGWELAIGKRSVALSLAAMGAGLAAGGLLAHREETR